MQNKLLKSLFLFAFLLFAGAVFAAPQKEKTPLRVAILGDSIAYGGQWPSLIQAGLESSPAFKDAYIVNFGLPSETVSGLSEDGHAGGAFPRPCLHERLSRIMEQFKPNLILACYGMNDGIYQPLDSQRFQAYKDGLARLKSDAEKARARVIFITPPLYQADKTDKPAGNYDELLDTYSDWLVQQRKKGWDVVDMRPALKKAVAEEKKKNPGFVYAGDGVHPGETGHYMIARAIWPTLAKILKLNPGFSFPEGEAFQKVLHKQNIRKLAWLTATKHIRPGIPDGVSLEALPYAEKDMRVSEWNGFTKLDFQVEKRPCLLILPKTPAKGNPWIWRTEFFGHEPQGDLALLEKGFHVAYIDLQNMYGAPSSLLLMDKFHAYLVTEMKLSPKPVLEGFSRGGLFALNWAEANPSRVSALYLDAPVCDFKSWPGGKGKGKGSPDDWNRLLSVYGFTEKEALSYKKNPVDNLAPLAKAGVPILSVVGDADDVVPVEENTGLLEKRYKALKGPIKVIHKPGVNHHPHSLKDPTEIVDFILNATTKK